MMGRVYESWGNIVDLGWDPVAPHKKRPPVQGSFKELPHCAKSTVHQIDGPGKQATTIVLSCSVTLEKKGTLFGEDRA